MSQKSRRRGALVGLGGFALAAALVLGLVFHHGTDRALVAMDAPLDGVRGAQAAIRGALLSLWSINAWLGNGAGAVMPTPFLPLAGLLPTPWVTTAMFLVGSLLNGVAVYTLARRLGLGWWGSAFGGLAMALANNAITLAYAGHVNKIQTYPWIVFACVSFIGGLLDGRFRQYVFAGAFLGIASVCGEIQIATYCGLWMVVWGVVWRLMKQAPGESWVDARTVRLVLGVLLVACTAGVVGFAAFGHYLGYLQTNAPVVGAADTNQNWLFATQFFFPPEEVLSFFTTIQFFGAPFAYWGRDGVPTPLRLSDDYLGLLPLGFAILGGIACWRIWQARLFIVMGLGSLLISFGREGGLFWLLYQLPTMKSQRNPHRWTYFVTLATCVLAAYGCNWLWERLRGAQSCSTTDDRRPTGSSNVECGTSNGPSWALWTRALLVTAAAGVLLFVAAGVMGLNANGAAQTFYGVVAMASPQAPLLAERTRCLLFALMRTGFFLALSAGAVWWVVSAAARKQGAVSGEQGGARAGREVERRTSSFNLPAWLPWAFLLVVLAFDLGTNAKRYVVFYPWKQALGENPLANFLGQDKDLFRVKVIGAQQNALLNNLVSNILPYHRIPVVDPPAASRIPNDYSALFKYFEGHYVRSDRYFDFFNVKYVLSPGPFSDPSTPFVPIAQWNGINVYRREDFLPRAWLVPSARVIKGGEEEILKATLHPLTNLRETVVLEEPPRTALLTDAGRPTIEGALRTAQIEGRGSRIDGKKETLRTASPDRKLTKPKIPNQESSNVERRASNDSPRSVRVTRYDDNRVELETEAAQPTILVLGDKWDPDWKAWLDGVPVPILKANFLMRAVELPSGRHSVKMEYRPSMLPFKVSAVCILLFAAYGLWAGLRAMGQR